MSHEIKATTDHFTAASANRHFVLNPLGDVSIRVETSDPDMQVCAVASRVAGALDYGAAPEAQRLMQRFIAEAEVRNHALSLTLNITTQPESTAMQNQPLPSLDKFVVVADPATVRTDVQAAPGVSDYDISAEYGGTQYANAVRSGHTFEIS